MPGTRRLSVTARLDLARCVVTAGDELEYTVVNTGHLPIMLGATYALERFENAGWTMANPSDAFRAWGRRLAPGQHSQLTARLPTSLLAGSYRLRKRLAADRGPRPGYEWLAKCDVAPCEATAQFTVRAA